MFKNYSDCTHCIHTNVCQYIIKLKEMYDKIGDYWNNLEPPEIFKLELNCKHYMTQIRL